MTTTMIERQQRGCQKVIDGRVVGQIEARQPDDGQAHSPTPMPYPVSDTNDA